MQLHTVSLCMIVKNEEKYLERCLKSVQGKVDEIIVVDTGSTDNTIEIARKYNSIIKHFEWINDFAAARNYSISEVRSEYILVLDADEYLDENADLQADLAKGKDYYRLLIKNYQSEGKSVIHQNVRLFKSGIGLFFSGKLHEHLNNYDESLNYSGAESEILIHHVGYLPEVVIDRDKNRRNRDIMVKELEESPTGYSYFNMAMVYMSDEVYDKALDMFKKAYNLSKEKAYIKGLLVRMGECLNFLGRYEEGINLMLNSVNVFPDYTDLHYTLGMLYYNARYLRDAEAEFLECLSLGDNKVEIITTEGVGSYLAEYRLAEIYEKRGKYGEAFDGAFKALMGNKNYYPALTLYLKLMKRAGISENDMQKQLELIYPIETTMDLNNLLTALYNIRHKLISKYNFVFIDDKLAYLRAVAYMLSDNCVKAVEEWEKIDSISKDNFLDILVLSLLTDNRSLMGKIKEGLNLSEREWKFVARIISKEPVSKKYYTADVEKLLLDTACYLLDIQAFDQFEYISKFLMECSADTQNKLAAKLIDLGYTDTAAELLSLNLERYPGNHEVSLLAGDIASKNNDLEAALELYNNSLKLKSNYYPAYERIYEIYEVLGDKDKLYELKPLVLEKFPLSNWLKKD